MCIVLFGNPLSIENQLTIEPLGINPKAYCLAEREFMAQRPTHSAEQKLFE